jgi:UDP-N-acetylglucosamine 2-epimerase (non-hydrolysing)
MSRIFKWGEVVPVYKSDAPILCVVGARPNFMKIAPIMAALRAGPVPLPARLLHIGQHYDATMKDALFTQLGIPEPDIDLEIDSASHAVQTAEIMNRFEPVLDAERPAAVWSSATSTPPSPARWSHRRRVYR